MYHCPGADGRRAFLTGLGRSNGNATHVAFLNFETWKRVCATYRHQQSVLARAPSFLKLIHGLTEKTVHIRAIQAYLYGSAWRTRREALITDEKAQSTHD